MASAELSSPQSSVSGGRTGEGGGRRRREGEINCIVVVQFSPHYHYHHPPPYHHHTLQILTLLLLAGFLSCQRRKIQPVWPTVSQPRISASVPDVIPSLPNIISTIKPVRLTSTQDNKQSSKYHITNFVPIFTQSGYTADLL